MTHPIDTFYRDNPTLHHKLRNCAGLVLVSEGVRPLFDVVLYGSYPHPTVPLEQLVSSDEWGLLQSLAIDIAAPRMYELQRDKYDPTQAASFRGEINRTLRYATSQGLVSYVFPINNCSEAHPTLTISVAKTEDLIDLRLKASPDIEADPKPQHLYGRLMGYPDTAINAYLAGVAFPEDTLPEEGRSFFNEFLFSQDWFSERQVPKRWEAAVTQASPFLAGQIKMYESWRRKIEKRHHPDI